MREETITCKQRKANFGKLDKLSALFGNQALELEMMREVRD